MEGFQALPIEIGRSRVYQRHSAGMGIGLKAIILRARETHYICTMKSIFIREMHRSTRNSNSNNGIGNIIYHPYINK